MVRSDRNVTFPLSDHSVDRVIATYVLDLLSEADIGRFFVEANRVLGTEEKSAWSGSPTA